MDLWAVESVILPSLHAKWNFKEATWRTWSSAPGVCQDAKSGTGPMPRRSKSEGCGWTGLGGSCILESLEVPVLCSYQWWGRVCFLRVKSVCVCDISCGVGVVWGGRREGERKKEREKENTWGHVKGTLPSGLPGGMLEHQQSIKEIICGNFHVQPEVEWGCIIHVRECRKRLQHLNEGSSPPNPWKHSMRKRSA